LAFREPVEEDLEVAVDITTEVTIVAMEDHVMRIDLDMMTEDVIMMMIEEEIMIVMIGHHRDIEGRDLDKIWSVEDELK